MFSNCFFSTLLLLHASLDTSHGFRCHAQSRFNGATIDHLTTANNERRRYPDRRCIHQESSSMMCTATGDFSSPLYWNELYAKSAGAMQPTEWHLDADALNQPLERFLGPATEDVSILNVGCGTSLMWARLYDHGWRNITNVDFSEECIVQGRPLSTDRPGVRWLVADVCNLSSTDLPDSSFHAAVDKGTLDAIACSEAFDWFLPRMARSLARVLLPGGRWICVSFTPPKLVQPLLSECSEWTVHVERLKSFWMYVGTKNS